MTPPPSDDPRAAVSPEALLLRRLREDLGDNSSIVLDALRAEDVIVGGWVRDVLLDRPSTDIDLCSADPERLVRALLAAGARHSVTLDAQRRTYRVLLRGDRWVDVALTQGGGVHEDLCRRDLTIGAIAWAPAIGLLDPTGGLDDLRRALLRVPRLANLFDDPLRALRLARFHAVLGFEVETRSAAALADVPVEHCAGERIVAELRRILLAPHRLAGLRLLERTGLLARVLPAPLSVESFCALALDGPVGPAMARVLSACLAHAPEAVPLGALLTTAPAASQQQWASRLHDRRWPGRIAEAAATIAAWAHEDPPMRDDGDRGLLLLRWRCRSPQALLGLAIHRGSFSEADALIQPFLDRLDHAAGARNPKGLAVPPLPRPLLAALDLPPSVPPSSRSAVLDALVSAQLAGTVRDDDGARRFVAAWAPSP